MKKIGYILAGVLIGGVLLNGNAINAAAGLMAQPSTQRFYVDGERVQMEAYSINGSNYVKLRDIGKEVGFNVTWNAEGNSAMIDTGIPYEDDTVTVVQPIATSADMGGTVRLPTDGSKYIPKVGDVILCDDGTTYEIKNTFRWENNAAAPGPLPDLPTPSYDWGVFPTRELPELEVKHYVSETGDNLFVKNLYETRRMQYTIYEALRDEPSAWRNGKPLATVELEIPDEYEAYTAHFWPWRESEITTLVHSRPNSRYYVTAWDYFHNGIFQHTRYYILSL